MCKEHVSMCITHHSFTCSFTETVSYTPLGAGSSPAPTGSAAGSSSRNLQRRPSSSHCSVLGTCSCWLSNCSRSTTPATPSRARASGSRRRLCGTQCVALTARQPSGAQQAAFPSHRSDLRRVIKGVPAIGERHELLHAGLSADGLVCVLLRAHTNPPGVQLSILLCLAQELAHERALLFDGDSRERGQPANAGSDERCEQGASRRAAARLHLGRG